MDASPTIEYHQTRDFSRKMSVTFEFIRQNFKSLGKSIMIIAGPPVLIASIMMGSFFSDMMSSTLNAAANPEAFRDTVFSANFWMQIALIFVFGILSMVLTIATINNYLILYEEQGSSKIEVEIVWSRVRNTFWMYIGTGGLMVLLLIVAYIALVVVVGLLAAASPILAFFGIVGVMCVLLYLIVGTSFLFFIRAYEKKGFFESLERSFRLIQGKWWSTFGLVMILSMIGGIASYILFMPWYLYTIVTSLHTIESGVAGTTPSLASQIASMFFFTLYYMVQLIGYSLPNVGIAFQYFNLVERKEARGLMSKIESFGEPQSPPTNSPDEHY
jgi:MFS family permease